MGNYVITCCNYYSLGVEAHLANLELDKPKKLELITPVIHAIIVWTVSSVKLLNNVVVGTGQVYEL